MTKSTFIVLGVLVLGIVSVHAEPANVVRADGICSLGWFGCSSDVAVMLPDGSWTCPLAEIGLVSIAADDMTVETNNERGNEVGRCSGSIEFGQPNVGGGLGAFDEVIALPIATVCVFLPDACQGNGSLIANTRTIGGLAVCSMSGQFTTDMQEVVAPSGAASLFCSLPEH